jgi:hypothetical protein
MEFLHALGLQFAPEIFNLLAVVASVLFMVIATWLALKVGANQSLKAYNSVIVAVAQKAVEFIIIAEWGDEYQLHSAEYEQKQAERQAAGDFFVDARMLYVLDKLEQFISAHFGYKLEFDDLLPIAEAKYRELKQSGQLPSVVDVTAAVKPPQ